MQQYLRTHNLCDLIICINNLSVSKIENDQSGKFWIDKVVNGCKNCVKVRKSCSEWNVAIFEHLCLKN